MARSGNSLPQWLKASVAVIGLLAVVAFGIGYLMRPSFVVSVPEMKLEPDQITVHFAAENRTGVALKRTVRVSLLDRQSKRSHGIKVYDTLGQKEMTLELAPGETRPYEVAFSRPEREPTIVMVEPFTPEITP